MQYQSFIKGFIILGIIIFVVYKFQLHSQSPLAFLKTKNCVKSMMESNDFICEPDNLWNERKVLYRIQDDLNLKKLPSSPFFMKNWEPNFHCSHARRIGRMGDGGKWVCDLFRLQNRSDCIVYSAGSSGDFSFEVDLKKYLPNCEIHTFDLGRYQCPKNVCTFHQLLLGNGKNRNSRTWSMIIKELGHVNRPIDVFKIDIEGWEFQFFPSIFQSPEISYPRQILVEIHPKNIPDTHRFFELLRNNNYVIFSKDPNVVSRAVLFEYAFLRLNSQFFE
jgi:hypothetical protein